MTLLTTWKAVNPHQEGESAEVCRRSDGPELEVWLRRRRRQLRQAPCSPFRLPHLRHLVSRLLVGASAPWRRWSIRVQDETGDLRFEDHECVRYIRYRLFQHQEDTDVPEDILKIKKEIEAEFFGEEQTWGCNDANGLYSEKLVRKRPVLPCACALTGTHQPHASQLVFQMGPYPWSPLAMVNCRYQRRGKPTDLRFGLHPLMPTNPSCCILAQMTAVSVVGTCVRASPAKPVFQNAKSHKMGVCCIAKSPSNSNMLLTGSYDEFLRVWDVRATSRPLNETSACLGGGVWRIKHHPNVSGVVLAACMHNGFAVVKIMEEGITVVEDYKKHESLASRADWKIRVLFKNDGARRGSLLISGHLFVL